MDLQMPVIDDIKQRCALPYIFKRLDLAETIRPSKGNNDAAAAGLDLINLAFCLRLRQMRF